VAVVGVTTLHKKMVVLVDLAAAVLVLVVQEAVVIHLQETHLKEIVVVPVTQETQDPALELAREAVQMVVVVADLINKVAPVVVAQHVQ
jgi:hypothetical protein